MADTLEAWLSTPYPGYNPNDAPAISAVLEALVAGEDPPRVNVARVGERLLPSGTPGARVGEITGYHVWYCCARYGRAIPVHVTATGELFEAPFDAFSCLANPPWNPNNSSDGWRETYNAALAALVP